MLNWTRRRYLEESSFKEQKECLRCTNVQLYIEMGEVEEEEVYNMEIADIRKMPRVKKKIRKRTVHFLHGIILLANSELIQTKISCTGYANMC